MEYLWSVALMLIMYTCAIFYYPSRLLKSGFSWILKYNPLYCTIDVFRSGMFGEPMNLHYAAYALGIQPCDDRHRNVLFQEETG